MVTTTKGSGMGSGSVDPMDDLERLRRDLAEPDHSHVTYREWCGQTILWVYRREPSSPTRCWVRSGYRDTRSGGGAVARWR